VRVQSSSLLERLFGGRLAPLVAQFQQDGGLSREDIAALRALLDQADRADQTPKAATPRKR
jgi:predicted transcriptional regulator